MSLRSSRFCSFDSEGSLALNAVRLGDAAPRVRDTGLQAERTALSWNRTALAILANALLVLRSGWVSREAPITALAFVLLIAAAAAMLYSAWRRQCLLDDRGSIAPSAIAIASATIVALGACVTAIASMIVR